MSWQPRAKGLWLKHPGLADQAQRVAMYIVISKPNRRSMAAGVSQVMSDLLFKVEQAPAFTLVAHRDAVAWLTPGGHDG